MRPDDDGWYSLQHALDPEVIGQLRGIEPVPKLSITKIPVVTVDLAKRLSGLRVEHLWLWSDVTRRAMRHVVQLPGLRVLDVLRIRGPGTMANFGKARHLEIFRANHYMREADLLEVTQCSQLRELGAQGAELSRTALAAILALPRLTSLDLESTRFDDPMARRLSRSRTLESLDIGATKVSGVGVEHLVQMEQLRSLDLWATAVTEADLALLSNLPKLEYLSLGNYGHLPQMDPERVTEFLLSAKSLKRVWLDGIQLQPAQRKALKAKLESLRLS